MCAKFKKNIPNWVANERDYLLVFVPVKDGEKSSILADGYEWREVSANVLKFKNMLLADFLTYLGINIPDYTQFLRIIDEEKTITFRAYDCMRISISVKYHNS